MTALVSAAWLKAHLDDPDLVILDCTNFTAFDIGANRYKTVSGRENWEKDNIPGSGFADFTSSLNDAYSPYRNALPAPETFATSMGALGVGDTSRVVLYDSGSSMWAARVWWMLRWIGFDCAAVLDGGLAHWKAEGKRTTTKIDPSKQKELTPHIRHELFVTKEDVTNALEDGTTQIIDALSEAQFTGMGSDLGICGHIPGAISIPATCLINPETGLYYSLEKLTHNFSQDRSKRTIVYCGSGIAAASVAYTMHRLGFDNIAIYMPGLQEWMSEANLPLVNGPKR